MITTMRSNDVYLGLPHDVFFFTMLQELVARRLDVELGLYRHIVGSLHLYEHNVEDALEYMGEGWQPTTEYMPSMPSGDPTADLVSFLNAEDKVRLEKPFNLDDTGLDKYWADLIRLLQLYRYSTKARNAEEVCRLCAAVDPSYTPYFEKMRARVAHHEG